ncbi:Nop2/Sun-like domain containing protein 5 [Carabus blaptoides fortunei]
MFIHSVKVPRLYKTASKIVEQVKENGASLKDLLYKKQHPNLKGIYSLVLNVLKNEDKLGQIIRGTQILIKENRLNPWLARVLITELLWGKGRLNGDCKPFQTILSYKTQFTDILNTLQDVEQQDTTRKVRKPRYVRINTLKLQIADAIEIFRNEGWTLLKCGDNSDYAAFLATVSALSEDQFIIDIHVKEVLVFPPNTEFYQHYLYINGSLILQDKASCLAPILLAPTTNATVLDMCSAPGMKSSQLASLVGTHGKVFAVERDQRRYETLCKLIVDQMGITNVKCINKDVLTLTAKEIPDVEYILVDPSCSGSGMLDRLEFENPEAKRNESRLRSLAGFQIRILRHALLNFPSAKQVVYSTCSLYPEENEEVVHQVLSSVREFKLVNLRDKMKAKWFNFGSDEFGELGQSCIYAKPEQDLTNGFFVAVFERITGDEVNKYFVKPVQRTSECENVEKTNTEDVEIENSPRKRKKSQTNTGLDADNQQNTSDIQTDEIKRKKKKKKSKNSDVLTASEPVMAEDAFVSRKAKKSRKNRQETDDNDSLEVTKKSKKDKFKMK